MWYGHNSCIFCGVGRTNCWHLGIFLGGVFIILLRCLSECAVNDCSGSVELVSDSLLVSASESYVDLVDHAVLDTVLIVIRSVLLAVILCSGGPGRLHLVFKISVGLELLLLRHTFCA